MPVGIGNELQQLLSLEGILGHVDRRFCRNALKAACVLPETILADPMTG